MAVYIVSACPPDVEGPKAEPVNTEQFSWARLTLQTHHHSQAVRRWAGFGRRVCPFHFTDQRWTAPHGCRTRLHALKFFLHLATTAQINAAVLAGDITRDEAENGIREDSAASRRQRRSQRRKANRPGREPARPVPYPLERADIS